MRGIRSKSRRLAKWVYASTDDIDGSSMRIGDFGGGLQTKQCRVSWELFMPRGSSITYGIPGSGQRGSFIQIQPSLGTY